MHMFAVALLATAAWSSVGIVEPSENAMREAFASDLSKGVEGVLAYVAETGGDEALARIREAHTDAFEVRGFRKRECRPSDGKSGYVCDFAVEVDTVAGPIETSIAGRFYVGPCGLAYDHDA
jgi:hypothetical protein